MILKNKIKIRNIEGKIKKFTFLSTQINVHQHISSENQKVTVMMMATQKPRHVKLCH